MEAAIKNGCKRIVITSSIAAIMGRDNFNQTHFTPEDWTDVKSVDAYSKSKTLAEKKAWEIQQW